MRTFKYISALATLVLAGCGVDKEAPVESPSFDATPVMEIYYSSASFRGGTKSGETCTISFSGDKTLVLGSEVKVFDCTVKDLPELAQDKLSGDWTYNLIHSGIPVDLGARDEAAKVVCLAYDSDSFYIYLNNSHRLIIPDSPEKNLLSFSLLSAVNPGLQEDLVPTIDGTTLVFELPPGGIETELIPNFSIRGKMLSRGGTPVVSGTTALDFTDGVTLDLELYDGTVIKYTVLLRREGAFPTIYLTSQGPINSKETYVKGTIKIVDEGLKYWNTRVFEGGMSIRGRGNSTWNMPKKPYKIKLDQKAKIFGLPSNKDWVLIANYADKSLLRNTVAMKISEILGFSWTPAIYSVEVYLNGTYQGLYNFMDHKEVAKHRIDIDVVTAGDNTAPAIEGGYYLEVEEAMDEPVCWWTEMGVPMMFKDPENPTTQQQSYVKNYFKGFEGVLRSDYFKDPVNGYAKYIDVESFAKNYIINELTKNVDGNLRKSTFLTKERGKKLEMYHVWDFDFTLGNCDYFDDYYGLTNTYEGWFIRYCGRNGHGSGWYYILMQDPAFVKVVQDIWNEAYPELLTVGDYIWQMYDEVAEAALRNFDRWQILNTYVWPNYVYLGDYRAEVDYLHRFYTQRLEWLNTELNSIH